MVGEMKGSWREKINKDESEVMEKNLGELK